MDPIVNTVEDVRKNGAGTEDQVPLTKPASHTRRRKKGVTNGDAAAKRQTPKIAPPSRRRVRVAEGIYRDRHGLAATVKVNGVQREIRFPSGTPLKTIRATARRTARQLADAAGRRAAHPDS